MHLGCILGAFGCINSAFRVHLGVAFRSRRVYLGCIWGVFRVHLGGAFKVHLGCF